jgi:hypothetical protein
VTTKQAVGMVVQRKLLLTPLIAGVWTIAPVEAQVVRGRVVDAATDEAVVTARVTLLDGRGEHVQTSLTDEDGRFILRAREAGVHLLDVDRLGYAPQRTDSFTIADRGFTTREVQLDPQPIEMKDITARAYSGRLLHEATLSGVYARRARSPAVGRNRVLVNGTDREFDGHQVLERMIFDWVGASSCRTIGRVYPIIFVDGWEADGSRWTARDVMNTLPVREVTAIEFYRDISLVPMSLRPSGKYREGMDFTVVRACGLLAVWTRGAPR